MFDITNKKANINQNIKYMLVKTNTMFEYKNLPETLPQIEIEKILQINGHGIITEYKNNLYIFGGSYSGVTDIYNNPTEYTVNNTYINLNKTYNLISDKLVLCKNDVNSNSLIPLFEKYFTLLCENEISLNLASINSRIQNLISANNDRTIQSAKEYLSQIQNGKLGIIAENQLFDSIKNQPNHNIINIMQLVEYNQYIKSALYSEIGINSNFNMKRERLNQSEVELNSEILYPYVDNMLYSRRTFIKKLNETYGLNVTVEFNSIWDYRINNGEPISKSDITDNNSNNLGG